MIKDILEKINEYKTIIIHRHVRPDPDALGSQGGLACFIKDNFSNKKVYVAGEDVPSLIFLNKMDDIPDEAYDNALVIVVDTANQARISDERYSKGGYLIKIDHHPNDDPYGNLMWVDTHASSVSEMIVSFYEESDRFEMSDEAARLLYAGIIGDTGHFNFNNTTDETFRKTAFLVKKPFDRQRLHDTLYRSSLPVIRLKGYVLEQFEFEENGMGYIKLPLEMTRRYQLPPEDASLLVNAFSNIEGIKAWVFFIEEENQIRVRMRSKGPIVNDIAAHYGGGGHAMAAGATVYSWEESDRVLNELRDRCRSYSN